jgi:CheY-like chemotaxis protein
MLQKKRTPLDCAIVDIRLLDMDRLKFLKVIKVDYPYLPVIIITGHGDPAIKEVARAQNADGYLESPGSLLRHLLRLQRLKPRRPKQLLLPSQSAHSRW